MALNAKARISDRRYGEIDLLRAVAIVLMVIFHLVYDLREFAGINLNYQAPLWFLLGKTSALLFMFVSGLSSGLSKSSVKRGFKVLFFALVITVVTYWALGDEYVRFGILHFLGVTMILAPLLFRLSSPVLVALAAVSALLGFWFEKLYVDTCLLLPFGLMYKGFATIDYYPLFPYLGATLLGMLAYRQFYEPGSVPGFSFPLKSLRLNWLSRNSLSIYLVHQPIILLVIFAVRFMLKH